MRCIKIFIILLLTLGACTKRGVNQTSLEKTEYNNSQLSIGILNYTVPGSWQRVQPSSSMRVDELLIDPISQTKLAIFIFPNIPNLVETNIARWENQFKQEESKSSTTDQFNLNGLPVTIYKAKGTYLQAEMPMQANSDVKELKNHSVLAGIVELSDGAWFFKTVGPSQVIENQEANFMKLINSIKLVQR